jgi:hypothetical protein
MLGHHESIYVRSKDGTLSIEIEGLGLQVLVECRLSMYGYLRWKSLGY